MRASKPGSSSWASRPATRRWSRSWASARSRSSAKTTGPPCSVRWPTRTSSTSRSIARPWSRCRTRRSARRFTATSAGSRSRPGHRRWRTPDLLGVHRRGTAEPDRRARCRTGAHGSERLAQADVALRGLVGDRCSAGAQSAGQRGRPTHRQRRRAEAGPLGHQGLGQARSTRRGQDRQAVLEDRGR